ncbi:DUF1302 domain-containing protein [Pseudomonas sp. LB3P14]
MSTSTSKYRLHRRSSIAIAVATVLGTVGSAQAFEIDAGTDWAVRWDNTLQYNLGARAQSVDNRIGNDPAHAESEYKFADRGDIVTNRLSLLTEFDAVYDNKYGMRVSASGWKDYAYDDDAETKPGYPSNYDDRKYSNYTKKYYLEGTQLLDAFVFTNFDIFERPSSLRVGRLTQYWGNSLFFSALGISNGQTATDLIKSSAAPGTQAKELALPRGQINFTTQLADDLSFSAQYFLEYEPNRMPEGGTFLGPADFLFSGPDSAVALGGAVNRNAKEPDNINDNFGISLRWSPSWLDGTLGAYFRQYDETQASSPFIRLDPLQVAPGVVVAAPTSYTLGYNEHAQLFGLSLDKELGGYSLGAEVSYRKNTALNGSNIVIASDETKGPRGDTLNVVLNSVKALERSSFYDTGTALIELGYVHKLDVTDHEELYKGVGTAACGTGDRHTGCSTDDATVIAGLFEPQWLQVFPGVDISTPLFAMYGLDGNGASVGVPVNQNDVTYSAGIKGVMYQRYNLTLQYNGYYGRSFGTATSSIDGSTYTAAGNNMYSMKDRNWWSLTFNTTF